MVMPNFLILGAAKAGTTSLYRYLKQHPQIYMSPIKEPKFFAVEGVELKSFTGPNDWRAIKSNGFINHIDAYQELFQEVSNEIAIGEASPWYLHSEKAPRRIKHYIPKAKLIAILRNPIDRAYSNFLHISRYNNEEFTDFSQALLAEDERIGKNWQPHWQYKRTGFYYLHLKQYFNLFDRSQIKICLYEQFSANPIAVLQDIFQFLNVDDTFIPDVSKKARIAKRVPKNRVIDVFLNQSNPIKSILKILIPTILRQRLANNLREKNLTKPTISLELRKQLIQEYTEDILKLEELIQQDVSYWLEC